MKTALEIPDPILRRAKPVAARRGIALRVFIAEAVEEKLARASQEGDKPWARLAGGLRHLHEETLRIDRIIKREFGKVETKEWGKSST